MKKTKKIASLILAVCMMMVTTYCSPIDCYAAEEDEFPYYASLIDGEDLKDEPYAVGNNLDYYESGNIVKVVGTTVNQHNNTWAVIEQYDGSTAYLYNGNLKKTDISVTGQGHFPTYGLVINANKDLKSAPYAASSNVENLLSVGDVLVVDSTCINKYGNEWAHVRLIDGKEGYFYYGDFQEIDCQDIYESNSKINIHAGPGSSYKVLENDVSKGTMFKYITSQTNKYGNTWYCVQNLTSEKVGYVYGGDLKVHTHDFQTYENVSICRKCGYYTENNNKEGMTRLSAAGAVVGVGGGFLDLGAIGTGLEIAGQIHPVVALIVIGAELFYINAKLSKAGTYDFTIEREAPYDMNKSYEGYHLAKTSNGILYISPKALSREEALKKINILSKTLLQNGDNGIYTASEEEAVLLCKEFANAAKWRRAYYKDCSHSKSYQPDDKCFYFEHYHLLEGITFKNTGEMNGQKKLSNCHIWFGLPTCPGEKRCSNSDYIFY